MAFNGAGVRDTARTLKIGINTVIRTLKNSRAKANNWKHHHIKRLARKTICFSRSVEIHEKVIGTFIEKHMFY
ncbi:Transposase [Shigella dysenteriae 1617]|uniref:Transposase n=1 Tax=Shigella dysenteriae 1617 TaxID=754093 RepID=A0A0A6ZW81_SHIDY|nr:Transposase [Shigella dysenteriae 1617]